MSYKTCYLCKHWDEDTGYCDLQGKRKRDTDYCSSIKLIPCCGSCAHWSKDYDSLTEGHCSVYQGLSDASSICKAGYYSEK